MEEELKCFTDNELLDELLDRGIEAKTINNFTIDNLIDELRDRNLTYSQESKLLDISRYERDEKLILSDISSWELIDELTKKGFFVIEAKNLMDEQKLNLVLEYYQKFTYEELNTLFTYGVNIKK